MVLLYDVGKMPGSIFPSGIIPSYYPLKTEFFRGMEIYKDIPAGIEFLQLSVITGFSYSIDEYEAAMPIKLRRIFYEPIDEFFRAHPFLQLLAPLMQGISCLLDTLSFELRPDRVACRHLLIRDP